LLKDRFDYYTGIMLRAGFRAAHYKMLNTKGRFPGLSRSLHTQLYNFQSESRAVADVH